MIEAVERIRHNGVIYTPGSKLKDINQKEEERLVNLGVALFIEKEEVVNTAGDLKAQLDRAFNATTLKESSKEIGLDFSSNISKANLIELIIKEQKAEEILALAKGEK